MNPSWTESKLNPSFLCHFRYIKAPPFLLCYVYLKGEPPKVIGYGDSLILEGMRASLEGCADIQVIMKPNRGQPPGKEHGNQIE